MIDYIIDKPHGIFAEGHDVQGVSKVRSDCNLYFVKII